MPEHTLLLSLATIAFTAITTATGFVLLVRWQLKKIFKVLAVHHGVIASLECKPRLDTSSLVDGP